MNLPEYVCLLKNGQYQLRIWVHPGAKKNEVVGSYQGCLKIRLKAPPVDDKANKALINFLARKLSVRSRDIQLKSGQKSRKKIMSVNMNKSPQWEILINNLEG